MPASRKRKVEKEAEAPIEKVEEDENDDVISKLTIEACKSWLVGRGILIFAILLHAREACIIFSLSLL